jgi:hypothetical protein
MLANEIAEVAMSFMRCARPFLLVATAVFFSWQSRASDLAVSQYGPVTATLPWAVTLEKGYFADASGIGQRVAFVARIDPLVAAEIAARRPF